ncbi:thiol-disulfide oxidoreductase [Planctomycetes bacterium K23_9]|uniref:Thiol-disulfide oxidoreductase n=2 Tax=Stieleria marina TaxID=1930275 RepID=A0A517P2J7_9BACT|nr:thiol-disulfide oxidoreductase [Planctomycetes bacterium K23_9]
MQVKTDTFPAIHQPSESLQLSPQGIALTIRQSICPRALNVNKFTLVFLTGCLSFSLVGCQSKTDESTATATSTDQAIDASDQSSDIATTDSTTESASDSETVKMPAADSQSVTVALTSWEDVQKTAASTNKITVLDVWSTVCMPCIKELPGLVDLHKELGDKVQCMTIDVDFDGRKSKPPTTYEKDVMAILKSIDAKFPNYICTTPSDDVYAAADIDSIPAVLIFDASGKLVKKFVDAGEGVGFGYHKDVIPYVKSLLEK